jgi:hypothetical protein
VPTTAVPPPLTTLVGRLAEAVPRRARATLTGLPLGAATTRGGHATDAILAAGPSRSWTTCYRFLQRGRRAWLAVRRALLAALATLFGPPVRHVVVDGTVVERASARAPGSLTHRNHAAEPNRSRFLRGRGRPCLAAVVEQGWRVGAVPLMPRLVRRGTRRGKLVSARFLPRLPGRRLGRARALPDAWFVRARPIGAALADGHAATGRARRDLALHEVPRPPRRRRGRPSECGPRTTPERAEAPPAHRSARILHGKPEVARYRTRRVAARFLEGRVVRAVRVGLGRPDRRDEPAEGRLLPCTGPGLPALVVTRGCARRRAVEPLSAAVRHGRGLEDARRQSRQVPTRRVTILAAGHAPGRMPAYADPARAPGLATPAPWRPPGTRTAGPIRAGPARRSRGVGPPALVPAISRKPGLRSDRPARRRTSADAEAA